LKRDDEEYMLGVFEEQFKYFGPFPAKIAEIVDPETVESIVLIVQNIPKEQTTPIFANH
jgi:putative lipoic acid-binding regulatory protein